MDAVAHELYKIAKQTKAKHTRDEVKMHYEFPPIIEVLIDLFYHATNFVAISAIAWSIVGTIADHIRR